MNSDAARRHLGVLPTLYLQGTDRLIRPGHRGPATLGATLPVGARVGDFETVVAEGFLRCCFLGSFAGTTLAGRLPQQSLRRAFATLCILVAVPVVWFGLR